VDYHLEHGLRLVTKPEASGGWAIQEVDAQGKQIGRDQIPWDRMLYFTATSCVLGDHSEIKSRLQRDEAASAPPVMRSPSAPPSARRLGGFRPKVDPGKGYRLQHCELPKTTLRIG
jgi:hypothetical protein